MGEVVKATAKAAKKGMSKALKIWLSCILAIVLVVGTAGGSFLVIGKMFETKLNQMVNDQYKGETGEQGPQGPQGVSILSIEKTGSYNSYDIYTISYSNGLSTTFQVKNGDDGEAPVIGSNGNWWINGEDTGVLADATLNMPYIGVNGNWWVGDSDTNVKAQGQDGLTPYIKDGNWWIGDNDTGVAAGSTGTGITAITQLDKTSADYNDYKTMHPDLDDLTDVYQILYSDNSKYYFTVTNGRDGGNDSASGTNGADANRWLHGTQEPLNTLGNPGDFYLHTPTNVVYQKQATESLTNQYNGKLVERTIDAETFADLQTNAADYGLAIETKLITYMNGITIEQINAMTAATGLSQDFYNYLWNYKLDGDHNAHLFGYYAADGALEINGSTVTKIEYTWQAVTTLKGADGSDGTNGKDGENGKSAYEVWRDYTEEDGSQPNIDKDENEFLNSLIIGSLEDFTILPSGFWGKKTDLTEADLDDSEKVSAEEKYLYEEIDGVYYKNTMVAARGEQGATGQKGEPGFSAYELYVLNTIDNPVKSMDEWFASLVGAKGDQGDKGEQGDKGADGYTPQVGPNGNWWINNTDTGVSATVRLPYVGENGNWFINGIDQGIKPTGDQGIAGNGIAEIKKTTVDGVVDTYKITFTNPGLTADDEGYLKPFTFTVTNGTDGKSAYEVWRDYVDADNNQPNLNKSTAEFFQALMGTDGNGIESIELVSRGDSSNDYVDTYKVTYTAQDPFYFTVRNGQDGQSVYDIWCKQQGYTDYADNKYYTEFINAMSVSTIEGLTVLDNGHWGVLSSYETLEAAQEADPDGTYSVGYQNKIYKDTGNDAKGESGAAGKSAYEIYCETFRSDPNNVGKEPLANEYLWIQSLKGEKGEDAKLEVDIKNGYWVINGVTTGHLATGTKGEAGDTPYIDEDGYWCVGNQNLGVLAQGVKGDKGDKGDTGATGVSITGVSKVGSDGVVDSYEITFSNGGTSTFTVTNGTNGTDGASITMDFGVPNATAKNGDIYINLNNGEMYRYNNGWGTVVGTMRGSQWFTGTMTLSDLNSKGFNIDGYSVIKNDIYLNTNTRDIYKYDGDKWVHLSSLGITSYWSNTGSKVIRHDQNVNVVGIHIQNMQSYSKLKLTHIGRRNCGAEVLINIDDSSVDVYFAGKNIGLESDGWSRLPEGNYLSMTYNGTDYTGAYVRIIDRYNVWVYFVFGGYSVDRNTWLYSTQRYDMLSIETAGYDIGTFVNMFKDPSNKIQRLTTFDPNA